MILQQVWAESGQSFHLLGRKVGWKVFERKVIPFQGAMVVHGLTIISRKNGNAEIVPHPQSEWHCYPYLESYSFVEFEL